MGEVRKRLDPRAASALPEPLHSPIIWTTISRVRGRVSNSISMICCQVPRASPPANNGNGQGWSKQRGADVARAVVVVPAQVVAVVGVPRCELVEQAIQIRNGAWLELDRRDRRRRSDDERRDNASREPGLRDGVRDGLVMSWASPWPRVVISRVWERTMP